MHKPWSLWGVQQWLHALEQLSVNSQEIQLGLSRISIVAEQLNIHTVNCPVITIAGTNGKGSTVSALESIYHNAGYRVASYTSPHLLHFNERIRVHLNPISDEELCLAFSAIEDMRGSVTLTYFEMTTLAALWHFKKQKLDLILLEVGLGGRLDATNIIDSDIAIITTIDYDHQELLGDTLEAIAYEKAGIMREATPFIYADSNPPKSIGLVASELSAPGAYWGKEYYIQEEEGEWSFICADRQLRQLPKPKIQLKSAAAAIMASILLHKQLPISDESYKIAMEKIFIAGRLELHPGTFDLLYDVSHNAQSARLLGEKIKQLAAAPNRKKIYAVFSALKDKDLNSLILPLKDYIDLWYISELENKRSSSASMLLSAFKNAEINVDLCYSTPLLAFEAALHQAQEGDLLVVYGSFFMVSQIMSVYSKLKEIQ